MARNREIKVRERVIVFVSFCLSLWNQQFVVGIMNNLMKTFFIGKGIRLLCLPIFRIPPSAGICEITREY